MKFYQYLEVHRTRYAFVDWIDFWSIKKEWVTYGSLFRSISFVRVETMSVCEIRSSSDSGLYFSTLFNQLFDEEICERVRIEGKSKLIVCLSICKYHGALASVLSMLFFLCRVWELNFYYNLYISTPTSTTPTYTTTTIYTLL